ncbi:hypothetical protein L916_11180 [Phytophthora nicotianae]|uniref:Uncharacterized protein n=2 Tax=Phytophthora nicotianae TaxID=4792 RepID=W2ITT1_PHYNI|nr:hypothetical protein L916_11180 [Phytophthora nicotianae]ETO67834.1 hypothetical protein F444_15282 [Phytophthora nicotianae P1976]
MVPKLTKVHLDESYCNVNHDAGATWIVKGSPRYSARGIGKRYCIAGEGAVFSRRGLLLAKWVSVLFRAWESHLKATEGRGYHGNNGELVQI